MKFAFNKSQIALAAIAAVGMVSLATAPTAASAAKVAGTYVTGDIHNHTTCSDGSISMQKLVKKSTGTGTDGWGLDWFVQAGHGGSGTKNCTLTEDATLDTPAYPFVASTSPSTTWQSTPAGAAGAINPKGKVSGSSPNQVMWRWQSLQEFQYPVMEYLATLRDKPLFLGLESVVAGHEHSSMSIINGQLPSSLSAAALPSTPNTTAGASRYTAVGNANLLAQWSYCFDRNDTDDSRGNTTSVSGIGNNWDCSFVGGLNSTSADWNNTSKKLGQGSGTGTGTKGHTKTLEALKWMNVNAPNGSYYIPAHLERAGQFYADGNQGFNIEHLRNMNNAAPKIAFAFESQPGHGASANRGEYQPKRNLSSTNDSVGTTTYGGTGVYAAEVGGVWDALLGEGRNWWFSASSDWHNRGTFGADDVRSTQDFYPGEYQRMYVMARNGGTKVTPQMIVDGMRSGNKFAASGQLIDRMAFIACSSYPGVGARTNAAVQALAVAAATGNTDIDKAGCATMGEKLVMPKAGGEVVVSIVVRDPSGTNNSPYSFNNPSLAQISVNQPLNAPVLDHVDVIRGLVTGYKTPGAADYSGEWPRNENWLNYTTFATAGLSAVPAAAKNTSTAVIKTFAATGTDAWTSVSGNTEYKAMTFRISNVTASQYVRLRGTNLPASVPYETDANGNPIADIVTNAGDTTKLRIPCTVTGTNVPATATAAPAGTTIDGCPAHLATVTAQAVSGNASYTGKMVSYDVAAWADLWFYSNPIYIQVTGSTVVAGVQ